ncbi:hypothetical protein CONCODRAFT_11938 [Conidiobolus coronatus NRRL 28638]|uniref:Uncharacterized protein n=1 Tax=Conidiobolus coronatus (strain ATCC 28846 / CBS 209.66 / NRRL 28638) TaxID=796925 RepID=A0A137NUH5_CONC2|nr:hypothetical protein CONCODRAFT_11938 [Conidiobolus coronatus NRRL 28638]|eukprot:KXN66254.1 hypothetical protein CONCODRAFT_11938 [Conidiobolus coronatus NRRL 28638]
MRVAETHPQYDIPPYCWVIFTLFGILFVFTVIIMWARPWQKYSLPINKPTQANGLNTIYIGNNDSSKILIVTPPESSFNNFSQQPPPQNNNPEIEVGTNSPKVSHFIWIVTAVGLAIVCLSVGLYFRFRKKDKAELNDIERNRVNRLNCGDLSTVSNVESSEPPPPYSRT